MAFLRAAQAFPRAAQFATVLSVHPHLSPGQIPCTALRAPVTTGLSQILRVRELEKAVFGILCNDVSASYIPAA